MSRGRKLLFEDDPAVAQRAASYKNIEVGIVRENYNGMGSRLISANPRVHRMNDWNEAISLARNFAQSGTNSMQGQKTEIRMTTFGKESKKDGGCHCYSMQIEDEIKQVIIIRSDLDMSRGKLVAQGAHASLMSYFEAEKMDKNLVKQWLEEGEKKIVLKVSDEEALKKFYAAFRVEKNISQSYERCMAHRAQVLLAARDPPGDGGPWRS